MVYKYTSEDIDGLFHDLAPSSRLWIFQSPEEVAVEKVDQINHYLNDFTSQWTSHNNKLLAKAYLFYNSLVVVVLDQSQSHSASGCSIDKLTHAIQHLGKSVGTDFMDRTFFLVKDGDEIKRFNIQQFKEAYAAETITDRTLVFNNLLKVKADLSNDWIIPLSKSWHKRFV